MKSFLSRDQVALWGGIECTVNRVQDIYFDQLNRSGHDRRNDDLDRIAELGFAALRYPVLWERTAPHGLDRADWSWPDARLGRLQSLGITPIVGLVHHGSGPPHTNLLKENFVTGLADFAAAVAQRYPWVEAYTPVNEPLTTARFSALYGHWYPHAQDDEFFLQALLIECRATVAAMQAIRRVNPDAKFIQTEDLAKVHSTPGLADQAQFENERRWVALDLLCGRVTREHPLWDFIARTPYLRRQLAQLADNPCPPDVIGFNHYLTSERLLDERLDRYPVRTHGGNGRQAYADVEALRARQQGLDGLEKLLLEAWTRFQLPMAVTEVHLGDSAEYQIRWLLDQWAAVRRLHRGGVDVRALTVWALLGSFDWNHLCTCHSNCYEAGAFEVVCSEGANLTTIRATHLANAIQMLARGDEVNIPGVPAIGWWDADERLCYPPVDTESRNGQVVEAEPPEPQLPFARACTV
jgi:dTDP-4-dehydrorhamnose reductase